LKSLPLVAVVGRPNVGKSTLFNRLVGRRVAIVDSTPGVTRDRLYAPVEWGGEAFELVDTAGILAEVLGDFEIEVRQQVDAAIEQADVLLFVVDGREGPTAQEDDLVEMFRRTGKPVILAVNKIDSGVRTLPAEFHRWGFERAVAISAMEGSRIGDLLDHVTAVLPPSEARPAPLPEDAILVAVIGQPNVGKSSLVNRLSGENRMLVSDIPGTTRDPVDTPLLYHGRTLVLIDTAGLKRKMKTSVGLDYYTLLRTVHSIERCDVTILLLDSRETPNRQDLRIANMALDNGKGLILAMNKWDLVENKETNLPVKIESALKEDNPNLEFAPMVFISARTGQRVSRLLDLALEVNAERDLRIATARLNEALREAVARSHPPSVSGKHIRLLYCTQVQTSPPVIAVYSNEPDLVPEHYKRYLTRRLREHFPFTGTPLRLDFRKSARKPKEIES